MPKVTSRPKSWLSDADYKFVYSRSPRLCVDLLIVNKGGFVLSKRIIEPYKNLWHFPGGKVNYKESIDKAVERIAKAEVGIKPKGKEFIGYAEMLRDGKFVHSVSVVFLIKSYTGRIKGSEQAWDFKIFKKIPKGTHPGPKKFLSKVGLKKILNNI